MSVSDEILAGAMKLSRPERARVARELLESLDPDSDSGAEDLWVEEIERRVTEGRSGQVELEDWGEVRERLRARFARRR